MNLTKIVPIDFTSRKYTTIRINQYEYQSREFYFELYDNKIRYNIPENVTIRIKICTNNGIIMLYDCEIIDNMAHIIFDDQVSAIAGKTKAQLVLIDIDEQSVVTTVPFYIQVVGAVYDEEIMSEERFKSLEDALLTYDTSIEHLKTYEESARQSSESASESANIATEKAAETIEYYNKTKDIYDSIGKYLTVRGSVYFEDLPPLSDCQVGDMYNIIDAFTTTDDFVEGARKDCAPGTNVYAILVKGEEGEEDYLMWDIFSIGSGSLVGGVMQLTTLPNNSEYKDKIVQYVGEDTVRYKHGYFYECKNDNSYKWRVANAPNPNWIFYTETEDPQIGDPLFSDAFLKTQLTKDPYTDSPIDGYVKSRSITSVNNRVYYSDVGFGSYDGVVEEIIWKEVLGYSVLKLYYTKAEIDARLASELAQKQDVLTFDTELDVNSSNPVTNSAIANAVNAKADKSELPTTISELTNDSGFITNSVNDLVNYYTKSQVDDLVSGLTGVNFSVVQQLPTHDISTHTIYLVPSDDSQTSNVYNEYIYINNNWELIGNTAVDLTDYQTKDLINSLVINKITVTTVEDALSALNSYTITLNNLKADKTEIPVNVSELTNDAHYASDANYVHTDNNYTSQDKDKLDGIESNAEANTIETISVNNVPQIPDENKNVNITIKNDKSYDGIWTVSVKCPVGATSCIIRHPLLTTTSTIMEFSRNASNTPASIITRIISDGSVTLTFSPLSEETSFKLHFWTDSAKDYHIVSFNSNGGTRVDPQSIIHDGYAIVPEPPTKDDNYFDDWYETQEFSQKFDFNSSIIDDTNVYAKWLPASTQYTVIFNTHGGTSVPSQKVYIAQNATRPDAAPTKPGCAFDDWYTDNQYIDVFDFSTPIMSDTEIHAYWIDSVLSELLDNNSFKQKLSDLITTKTTYSGNNPLTYITTIRFLQVEQFPSNYVDVSKEQNGTVVASISSKGVVDINFYTSGLKLDKSLCFGKESSDSNNNYPNLNNIIGLNKLDTTNTTNIDGMFSGIPMSNFDISFANSTLVSALCTFEDCNYLTDIDLSNLKFNTLFFGFYGMFKNCRSLTNVILPTLNTNRIIQLDEMFFECSSLKKIDLSPFNNIGGLYSSLDNTFNGCKSLTELILPNFDTLDTTRLRSMRQTFGGCHLLESIDLSNLNTTNVTNMHQMFWGCSSLQELDLSNFNTANVTNMYQMFYLCSSLRELNLSNFSTAKVTNMQGMFEGMPSDARIIIPKRSGTSGSVSVANTTTRFYGSNTYATPPTGGQFILAD